MIDFLKPGPTRAQFLVFVRARWKEILAVVADIWTIVGISILGFLLPYLTKLFGVKFSVSDSLGAILFYFVSTVMISAIGYLFIYFLKEAWRDFTYVDPNAKMRYKPGLFVATPSIIALFILWAWMLSLGLPYLRSAWANLSGNQYLLPAAPTEVFTAVAAEYDEVRNLISGHVSSNDSATLDISDYRVILYMRLSTDSQFKSSSEVAKVDTKGDFIFQNVVQYSSLDRFFVVVVRAANVPYSFSYPYDASSPYATDLAKFRGIISSVAFAKRPIERPSQK